MSYVHTLRIRFGECDPQGILFNAHYLALIDVAVTEFMRDAFGSYERMIAEHGADLVVAEAVQRFRAPARADDLVDIALDFPHLGTTSATMRVAMTRESTALMDGELRYVFVDPRAGTKMEIPARVRAALADA